jgi:hypothetical protein
MNKSADSQRTGSGAGYYHEIDPFTSKDAMIKAAEGKQDRMQAKLQEPDNHRGYGCSKKS